MKINRKNICYSLIVIGVVIFGILIFRYSSQNKLSYKEKNNYTTEKNNKEESRDIQKITGNIINNKLQGDYLKPLITIAKYQKEFTINLDGISKKNKVEIINPVSGVKVQMKNNNRDRHYLNIKMDKNIDYGILIGNRLIGSIRIVDNIDEINEKTIYDDIMENLKCGL